MLKRLCAALSYLFLAVTPLFAADITVSIEPDLVSVKQLAANARQAGGAFYVNTTIRANRATKIDIYSCSYGWNWQSDNEMVATGVEECAKNVPQTVQLDPGQIFNRSLMLGFTGKARPGRFRMKLRFTPAAGAEPVWSNAIDMEVEPSMLKVPRGPAGGRVSIVGPGGEAADETKGLLLKVSIEPDADSLSRLEFDPKAAGSAFLVRTRIVNEGAPQDFTFEKCEFGRFWTSDHEGITTEVPCTESAGDSFLLQTGRAYERALPVALTRAAKQGPVRFRLMFSPIQGRKDGFWSDPVEITVTPGMLTEPAPRDKVPVPAQPVTKPA